MPANPPLIHCSGWLRAKRTRPVLPHLVPQGGAVCEGVQYISAYLVLSCFFNQLVSTDIARATGCRRYVSRAFIVSQPSFPFVWPSSSISSFLFHQLPSSSKHASWPRNRIDLHAAFGRRLSARAPTLFRSRDLPPDVEEMQPAGAWPGGRYSHTARRRWGPDGRGPSTAIADASCRSEGEPCLLESTLRPSKLS